MPIQAWRAVKAYRKGRWNPMDRTINRHRFGTGDRVEVLTHFTGTWAGGFEIASTNAHGCHVRRVCDGEVLPVVFGYDDIRPIAPTPELDANLPSTDAEVLRDSQCRGSVVLRLPATLDIATVEAIRDSVLDAVDHASGDVVLDLDAVEFLDSYGIRLLITARRRAWERDLPVRLHGGKPLIRDLLDLVGQDPLYRPETRGSATSRIGALRSAG